jgi:hypothetical protein
MAIEKPNQFDAAIAAMPDDPGPNWMIIRHNE